MPLSLKGVFIMRAGVVGGNLVLSFEENLGPRPVQTPLSSMVFGQLDLCQVCCVEKEIMPFNMG